MSETKIMPRTAVVTGGNSGVGFAVAEALGKKGYKVWIVGRNTEKGMAAVARLRPNCPAGITFLQLDVMLFSSIEQFIRTIKPQLGGRLDALVHSMGTVGTKRKVSADGLEEVMRCRATGHIKRLFFSLYRRIPAFYSPTPGAA